MKKLGEIIPNLSAISSPETNNGLDSSRADKVWLQLAQMFGNAFYRENGDEPGPLWKNAIDRLTDHEIVNGLANLANDNLRFPANLSMFVSACRRENEQRPWKTQPKQIEDTRPLGNKSRLEWIKDNPK